ncbi:hypothetical protein [Candidatus Magnetominusculus dajiuhuensis]|uniref:hypothetical protein n=1 Tax=Candidatus Magnetominusculus dajiuhuensis TaxID=3137712 RepID=UPI003B429710
MNNTVNKESQDYTFEIISGSLIFKTESFKAEKRSVLHSGVYNREVASAFVAAGAACSYFAAFALSGRLNYIHYAVTAVLFAVFYPLSWLFIFKRPALAVFLNNEKAIAAIAIKGVFRKKRILRTLSQLRDVAVAHVKIEVGNPDGVAFVEKIALQHGTVIPGLGVAQHVYAVEFVFDDGPVVVYCCGDEDKAAKVCSGFKDYLVSA